MANKNMKRIHNRIEKVAIKRIPDEVSQSDEPCIGIVAECEIWIPLGKPQPVAGQTWLRQNLSSGGLWGIEYDLDTESSYCKSVEKEELNTLRDVLHAIGFSQRAITAAFRNVTRRGVE